MSDIAEAVENIRRGRASTNASMISSFDADPEEAAEAVRLGKDTGVAPVLVNNDLDGFKRQQKVHLVTNLVENNPYLRDFVANDPMAPKVAHDDIGNLDKLTMNTLKTYAPALVHPLYAGQKIGSGIARMIHPGPLPWERGFMSTFLQQNPELVGEFLEGASHGTPEILRQQMLSGSQALKDLSKLSPEEYKRQNESIWEVGGPLDFLSWLGESAGSAVGSAAIPIAFGGIGTVAGIPGGPPTMAAGAFLGASSTSYIMNYGEVYQALKRAGVDPVVAQQYSSATAAVMTGLDVTGIGFVANRFMKAAAKKEIVDGLLKRIGKEAGLGAVVEGTTEGIQEIVKDVAVGIAADKGIMTKENAKGWVESALQGAVGGAAMTGGAAFVGGPTPTQKAKPWIDAGKEPPAGIHPSLDKLKEGQAQNDMDRLDGLLKDAQATNLRERSPEMVAELLRRQLGDTAIEIPAQAVFELYGDKPVTAEDGMLGWVKDLESQMRSEYPGGGYVSVPVREWLANVDPEVAKILHDHILTRPAGVTINEGKSQEAFDVYHGTPHFFDVFDLQKVGTGEGAQTYGHGLYFGQAPAVAETYRTAGVSATYIGGRPYSPNDPVHIAAQMQDTYGTESAIDMLDEARRDARYRLDAEGEDLYRRAKSLLADKIKLPEVTLTEGNLLRTRIHAELEQFIDLDRKLSEQPGINIEAINQASGMGQPALPEMTGQEVYRVLSSVHGPKGASEILKQAGIPGSRYLDQFSRAKGEAVVRHQRNIEMMEKAIARGGLEGDALTVVEDSLAESKAIVAEAKDLTYNIVLFDPALAQIIERNGQVIASTREAASLGVMTDLGPQAEYMLFQNRLQMQAIMDRLNRAEKPEDIAALREELKQVGQTLRARGWEVAEPGPPEVPGPPGWIVAKGSPEVPISFVKGGVKFELDVKPITTNTLQDVMSQFDFSPISAFGSYLQPITDRILALAANVPVHVVSDADFAKLFDAAGVAKKPRGFHTTYSLFGDHIVFPQSVFYGNRNVLARLVFHEAVHGATARALYDNPTMVRAVKTLMDSLEADNPELKGHYGYRNEHEFLAESLSNREFQDILMGMQLSEQMAQALGMKEWQGKTVWQAIVETIRRALNIPEGAFSALEGALRVSELVMGAQEVALAQREARVARVRSKEAPPANISEVFEQIKAEQGGIGTVYISDIVERMGLPKEVIHEVLTEMARRGEVTLARTSVPEGQLTPAQREGTLQIGDEVFHTATLREGGTQEAPPKQLELDVTRQEDLKIFEEARLVGLNAKQYTTMIQHIAERNALDTDFLLKKVGEFVRKKLSKEWKENEVRIKSEVTEAIENRPDIALMTFFRTGRLYGEQFGIPKINPALLTPEQRKNIPDRWQSSRGTDPMDFANLVGYSSVDQMALRAALLTEQMIAAKQPSLRKHVDSLIKAETERRMMKEYGSLSENILAEVQDHVVSPIQMDLLHEDTVAMGMKNGWTMPFTKAEVVKGVKAAFGQLRATKVSMEKFLRDAGKAGKLSGIASEIDKNPTEFFKQRQNQEYALRKAAEAKVLEKELASFERTADKLSRREARTVDQTYFNYAQDMLEKAGLPTKNSRVEIDRSIAFEGHASMDAFIAHEKGGGVDLDLFIPEAYSPKPFEEMTVDEFREFKEVVDTLDLAGRIRRKLTIEGDKRDLVEYEDEVVNNLGQMPIRKDVGPKGRWMYRLDAVWTRMEEIVKDLDLRQELGPLWKGLIHPFELAKSKKFGMMEALAKHMKELKGGNKVWQRSLADEIPHDFVWDSRNEIMFKLTRWNLIKMMLNVGNESNKAKLARGIASAYVGRVANGQETEIIMDRIDALIDKHANKEDWQFVQNIWNIFQGFADQGDEVVRATMGKVPKWIEATPVSNRHGTFAGGYVPLIRDKIRPIEGQEGMPDVDVDALMGPDFYRVATSRPHHLERTGAVYFVDITNGIENLAGRMQQHIHDIAYREFVMDAGKIIYNKRIMNAITKRYGVEYADQMEPWLKRIANEFTIPEKELGVINDVLRFFRLNLTAAALPLNYAVMYSPSVGTMNVRQLFALGAETQADRKKILANSEELKHVLYTLDRDLTEQLQNVVGGKGAWAKWTSFQRRAVETMYKPLVAMEQETRSVTFYGEFMAQKGKGLSDEEAAALADSVVRERHGAVSPGDLPAMMASNSEFVKVATVFMGYFSMIRNWTRQLPGQYRRGEYADMAKTVWGTVIIAALFNAALFTKRKESDTIWSFLSKAILDTPMSMVPYVREGWGYFTEGRRPTSPLFGWILASANLLKDGWNAVQGKEVKHPVRHTLNFLGLTLGVPAAVQAGRTGEFATDVARDKQRPKDFIEWIRGLHTGEAKLRK